MSETGIVSQEYQQTAELFRAINQSVIVLKKKHFNLTGAAQVTADDLSKARELVAAILRRLIGSLSPESSAAHEESDPTQIPPFFIHRLQERHAGEVQWYLDDLRAVLRAVESGQPLTDGLIAHLDELCGQLDAETTAIHRRLWRK